MATAKTIKDEREYVIPLRREWMKVPRYKRTAKSVKAVKEFIAKHMRVVDRDTSRVKLDVYLNNEMWYRGVKTPFSKVKVKARRDGEIVIVELVKEPEMVKYIKARQEKIHKKPEKKKKADDKKAEKEEKKEDEEKKEGEKTTEEKKEESEKAKSGEDANIKMIEQANKAEKHTVKGSGPQIHRKALKK